jgi:hypothetical protein
MNMNLLWMNEILNQIRLNHLSLSFELTKSIKGTKVHSRLYNDSPHNMPTLTRQDKQTQDYAQNYLLVLTTGTNIRQADGAICALAPLVTCHLAPLSLLVSSHSFHLSVLFPPLFVFHLVGFVKF